jgi:hypothetical protein
VSKNTNLALEPCGISWNPGLAAQRHVAGLGGIGALARVRSAWAFRTRCWALAYLAWALSRLA